MTGRSRSFVRSVALAVAAVAVPAACAEPMARPPASAPVPDRPASLIPGDLDVAIRLDLDAARRLLGPAASQALQLDIADAAEDPRTAALVGDALASADVAWVALRPGLAANLTDNVLVLRGKFAGIEPPREGKGAWSTPVDLGAAFRVYARPAPKRRSAPSRLYARADDWLVFVSEAEVDSAERSIERRAGDEHVDPPEHGIVSLAARVPPLVPLLAEKFPAVAEALGKALRLEATVDADDRGLRAELEVRYQADADATEGRARVLPLLEALRSVKGPIGRLARGADATAIGPSLVLRVTLDGPGLAALIGCFEPGGAGGNRGDGHDGGC